MLIKILIVLIGLVLGVGIGYVVINKTTPTKLVTPAPVSSVFESPKGEVIGFLPYWLLDRAAEDYSKYITTLSYFALTIDKDGTIKRFTNPIEGDPAWFALKGGKVDSFIDSAKKNNIKLSLTLFTSDEEVISSLISDPVVNAKNLVDDVIPVMSEYGFTDLNVDVESISQASPEARVKFSKFISEIDKNLKEKGNITLTVDVSPITFVKEDNLSDPKSLIGSVDYMVLMAYDFHNPGSFVTGANSPAGGAGITAEFDTKTGIEKALEIMPPSKLILGMPLYGYQWETINKTPKSAVVPGSSIITSDQKVEEILNSCATCSPTFDKETQESYVVYKDEDTGTYHQVFYPDKNSTQSKIDLAKSNKLYGVALWALGYEGSTILEPLASYRR